MSYSQYTIVPLVREYPDVLSWLLAIVEVVNTGSRLAPQKAFQKQSQELIDVYGSVKVWEGIKNFSETFKIADIRTIETLFESYPDLPNILVNEEETKKALGQWFENNSEKVQQTHQ